MNSKVGIFGVLFATMMMLLIPATSMINAQQYDSYYEDEYYYEEYYYSNDKKEKEPPMLLVKKDVLYCDVIASGTGVGCGTNPIPGPNSDRYVQECTDDNPVCNNINGAFFDMIVTDNIEFPGSEDGKKITFNGERYTVTEEKFVSNEFNNQRCQEAGFDNGFQVNIPTTAGVGICVMFEGECSGIVQDGELKECTVENYVFDIND